jgi:VWFA-related protein
MLHENFTTTRLKGNHMAIADVLSLKRCAPSLLTAIVLVFVFFIDARVQETQAQITAQPSPTPIQREGEEQIRILTEEVRLPVVAYNDAGRFDPTLAPEDFLVLEDNVAQQVRSLRREPASLLVVLDLGSRVTATRSVNTTREAVLNLFAGLRAGDQIAIVQNSRQVETVQDWTTDIERATHTFRNNFQSSNRSRLTECLTVAADKLRGRPAGNTHLVIFTEGLESSDRNEMRVEPIAREILNRIIATQATVHIFSYAALVVETVSRRTPGRGMLFIDNDWQMMRWYRNYAAATRQNESRLVALAEATGGRIIQPASTAEAVEMTNSVWRDIGAQYVVTYTPRRPLDESSGTEQRRISVFPRRVGLRLISLRSHIVAPAT